MIQPITYEQASELIGDELPDGYNWYQASKLQYYPEYGDWKQIRVDDFGVSAIIGKRKQGSARVAIPEGERVGEVERV